MNIFVNSQKEKYKNLWAIIDKRSYMFFKYDKAYKKQREKQLNYALSNFIEYIKQIQIDENNKKEYRTELKDFVRNEMKSTLGLQNSQLEYLLFNDLLDNADDFIADTEKFGTDLDFVDIMQAMRNVWIMNILQLIADIDIEYTPSVFAYSMIYPYTDNFLDDKCISNQDKKEFNDRLEKRLEGQKVIAQYAFEQRVYDLIEMIESQYDRKVYPKVYESIIAINDGQKKSLHQQQASIDPQQLLDISVEKGGTSVLADGFLVCGHMSYDMASFTMGFGFVLQLIDDLQDIYSDRQSESVTLFSQHCSVLELENRTIKAIAMVYEALKIDFCTSQYKTDIKNLMCDNCILMIMDSIAVHKKLFSKKFLREIEQFSPVRLKFLIKARKKFKIKTKDIDFNDFR